jgi:hypothetical protein
MSFAIAQFAGDEATSNQQYRVAWRPALVSELSRHAHPCHVHGLLGFALSAAEYATFSANPFVPLGRPNHPGLGAVTHASSHYNDEKAEFKAQETARTAAISAIISSLGPAPLELLRDPVTMRYSTDLAVILSNLDMHYATVTRQELMDAQSELEVRYHHSKDFKSHVAKHRQLHNTFVQAGNPISDMEKVSKLAKSVDHDPEMRSVVLMYFTAYPNLANQTFNELATRISTLMANRPSTHNEFANAAASTKHTSLATENEELKREIKELQRLLKVQGNPKKFCWTHGVTGHTSEQCRYPASGHQNDATIANKMGGGKERGKK